MREPKFSVGEVVEAGPGIIGRISTWSVINHGKEIEIKYTVSNIGTVAEENISARFTRQEV